MTDSGTDRPSDNLLKLTQRTGLLVWPARMLRNLVGFGRFLNQILHHQSMHASMS